MTIRTTGLSPTTMDRLEKLLRKRRALIVHAAESFRDEAESAIGAGDMSDLLDDDWPVPGGGEESMMLAVMAEDLICDIDGALRRMEEGTYGWCMDCGDPIPIARLEALPAADRCVPCKRRDCR